MKRVELGTLACLQDIVDALKKTKQPTSATRLKRYHNCDEIYFDRAGEYGHENDIIEWGERNIFTLLEQDWKVPEAAYYEVCSEQIRNLWENLNFRTSEFFIEQTANRDSKIVGRWTRPDLTLVSFKKFPWTIGNEFDVVTFEIKRPDASDVLAVFEALSHGSAATKTYVVFPMSRDEWINQNSRQAQRVIEECGRHGVGLILIENALRKPKPIHEIPATRREIDHEKCSAFLDAVMSGEAKNQVAAWK